MTPIRKPLPKDKQSPLQRAKMADRASVRLPGQTKANPIEAKHRLKYGESLRKQPPGPRPSAYAVANKLPTKQTVSESPKPAGDARPISNAPPTTGGPLTKPNPVQPMKKGGKVKYMAKGGSASNRADGCVTKGKTKGKII